MVSGRNSSTPFRRLGTTVYRRRRYVIVVWIIALVLVVPLILNEGKVSSLNQVGTTGTQSESARAANIISAEFAKTVANSTLLVVVSTDNASSLQTQSLVRELVSSLKAD